MSYDQPDKSDGFKPSEHPEWLGRTFLVWPVSEETVVFTRDNGDADPTLMVTADIAIIDLMDPMTGQPVFLENAKVGGKMLAPKIRPNKPNRKILGRLASQRAQKGMSYFLDVPDEKSPEWAHMCQTAQQYEAQFPRQTYQQPTPNGNGWSAATPPTAPTANAWGSAASAQQTWGSPAPTTAPPAQNNWASAPPAPAPLTGAEVAEKLRLAGYDLNQIPDEATARQILATL